MREKYLLCRTQGGINDTLSQIDMCWRYAQAHRRTLVVDTSRTSGFALPFGRFFREKPGGNSNVMFYPSHLLLERMETMSTFPEAVSRRISAYKPVFDETLNNFIDEDSGVRLSFDFRIPHEADLLVHDQCGGTLDSLNCLGRLRLTNEFKRDVVTRLVSIGEKPFDAIAVRHSSDYQKDYESSFKLIYKDAAGKRLLVCSDNEDVISFARQFFDKTTVLSFPPFKTAFSNIPYVKLLQRLDDNQRYELVVKAFTDLLGLAFASKLHLTRLKSGGLRGYSGFVLLAANLNKNKQHLQSLLRADA